MRSADNKRCLALSWDTVHRRAAIVSETLGSYHRTCVWAATKILKCHARPRDRRYIHMAGFSLTQRDAVGSSRGAGVSRKGEVRRLEELIYTVQ